jgi:Ser/Thr protein kinase RdoA (MazF antagonist)
MARAATLECVAAHEYPAPRLIPTHAGDPVGLDGAWLTLATSYVEGAVLRPTLGELRRLGESLGRLHALPVALPPAGAGPGGPGAGAGDGWPAAGAWGGGLAPGGGLLAAGGGGLAPGHAAWHPAAAIPAALDRLDRVASLVPDDWRPLHGQFRAAVLAVAQRLGDLPLGVVHGDAWPGNAVQSGPGGVTLIGWETGGAGLPVLDLGHCLIESLLDVPQRGVRPDEDRIAAVASGYSAQRLLTRAERDVLLPAIRFATACAGAIHLEQALLEGVLGASMDARWARLRNRIEVSEAVARLASPHLPGEP